MKQKIKKPIELVKFSKTDIVSFVASQLAGKDLFPKKTEEAKRILSRARIVKH